MLFYLQFIINIIYIVDFLNSLYDFILDLNLSMFSFDEFFIIFCFYNFFKLISISALMELL